MAHEISSVNVNGRTIVEAMYANRPAWHGLGEIFDKDGRTAPDSATAMQLAHLDWQVGRETLQLATDGQHVPGVVCTVRQDNRQILGVVSERYQVVQNHEAFAFMDSLLQDGIMRYESAMALQDGRRVVLLARMPEVDTIAAGDQSLRYVLMSTSHDGSAALYLQPTSVRVVCANTLRVALNEKQHQVRIVHTGNVKRELETAKLYLSQFSRAFTLYSEQAATLATRRYSAEQAQDYMRTLFPEPDREAGPRTLAGWKRKMADLRQSFHSNANRLESIRGTWWAMFNTITETLDHGQKYRGSTREQGEKRFLDVIEGTASDFKAEAFKLALSMSM